MANENNAMNSLKGEAVQVYTSMLTVVPKLWNVEVIDVTEIKKEFNNCYAIMNQTICFVTGNEVFVIPYTRRTMYTLCAAGLHKASFQVPFSNGECPMDKDKQTKWKMLREKAQKANEATFVEDCIEYCDMNDIGTIDSEILKSCFQMPIEGVEVNHKGKKKYYYPVSKATRFNGDVMKYIGHFCVNNRIVVFVYRDGKTYVAKRNKVLQALLDAGYTRADLFVPFSNGEQIQEPTLKARWEMVTK